jgi:hypothetical protein
LEREVTLATPVNLPAPMPEEVTLDAYLSSVVKRFHLIRRVQNGVVVIGWPPDDRPSYQTATAAEARTWLLLHESIPLRYPEAIPLRAVLDAIGRATAGKGQGGRGLVIRVDERGLKGAGKTLDGTVSIDLEGTPLCTSLALVLGQCGLSFSVHDDGIVYIRSPDRDGDLMDEAEVFDALRVEIWGIHQAKIREETQRKEAEKRPAKTGQGTATGKNEVQSSRPAARKQ